jgi:hypothetical protein
MDVSVWSVESLAKIVVVAAGFSLREKRRLKPAATDRHDRAVTDGCCNLEPAPVGDYHDRAISEAATGLGPPRWSEAQAKACGYPGNGAVVLNR